jgi:D-glycero-D-manno-heptose 1,7-bisphosphate phosphatase
MNVEALGPRAVFLDRDGTLIEDVGYPREPDRVRLLAGVAEGLAGLQTAGWRLVVVSNQSGIGRGIITEDEARAVHEQFVALLAREGISLDDVRYCPHAPWEECECRKPAPGLLLATGAELGLDLTSSFMIGDKPSDVEAGRRAGTRTVLFAPAGAFSDRADHVARDWADTIDFIANAGAVV